MKFLNFKFIIFSIFFLLTYYSLIYFGLPFLAHPRLQTFQNYYPSFNWDQKQHVKTDLDQDGQNDLLTFTGCLFLSSSSHDQIPADQQCTAEGIYGMYYPNDQQLIGQKVILSAESNLGLDSSSTTQISHSYLAKKSSENWKIFVTQNRQLSIYEIKNTGIIEKINAVPFLAQIDEFLYLFSSFFLILLNPIIPLLLIYLTWTYRNTSRKH